MPLRGDLRHRHHGQHGSDVHRLPQLLHAEHLQLPAGQPGLLGLPHRLLLPAAGHLPGAHQEVAPRGLLLQNRPVHRGNGSGWLCVGLAASAKPPGYPLLCLPHCSLPGLGFPGTAGGEPHRDSASFRPTRLQQHPASHSIKPRTPSSSTHESSAEVSLLPVIPKGKESSQNLILSVVFFLFFSFSLKRTNSGKQEGRLRVGCKQVIAKMIINMIYVLLIYNSAFKSHSYLFGLSLKK